MGWWSVIKGIVFGAPKLTEDIFDKEAGLISKAGGFINNLHYSDAEKVIDKIEIGKSVTNFVKATLGENTIKSKTRRSLAVGWIELQVFLILVTAVCVPISDKLYNRFYNLATCRIMFWGTTTVLVYFFGSYGYDTYVKRKGK